MRHAVAGEPGAVGALDDEVAGERRGEGRLRLTDRLDARARHLRRLCDRLRSVRLRRPAGAAAPARLPGRRAGLHRHCRRLRRRQPPAAADDPGVPRGQAAGPGPADGGRHRPQDRSGYVPPPQGLELRAYVHELYRHLAACDLAVVQGGLSTSMELAANRRPFLYFPPRHHFEQNFHVAHRLDRYRAGRRMDYASSDPRRHRRRYRRRDRPHRRLPAGGADGAARAARLIAELV
jgi:hypothetical protein